MIPFNLPYNPKPSPAVRKPNPLRASGPYYHICYVRCAISNLRPPNCFYNMSPVHPRFLFSQCLSLSSFSLALSTSLKCSFDKQLRARSFSSSDSFRSSQFKLNTTQLASYISRDDKFHSTNRAVFRNTIFPQGRMIINTLPYALPSIPSSFPPSLPADYESSNKTKVITKARCVFRISVDTQYTSV